jgi:hypothetical protein
MCENCENLFAEVERQRTRAEAAEAALLYKSNQLLHVNRILNGIPTAWGEPPWTGPEPDECIPGQPEPALRAAKILIDAIEGNPGGGPEPDECIPGQPEPALRAAKILIDAIEGNPGGGPEIYKAISGTNEVVRMTCPGRASLVCKATSKIWAEKITGALNGNQG